MASAARVFVSAFVCNDFWHFQSSQHALDWNPFASFACSRLFQYPRKKLESAIKLSRFLAILNYSQSSLGSKAWKFTRIFKIYQFIWAKINFLIMNNLLAGCLRNLEFFHSYCIHWLSLFSAGFTSVSYHDFLRCFCSCTPVVFKFRIRRASVAIVQLDCFSSAFFQWRAWAPSWCFHALKLLISMLITLWTITFCFSWVLHKGHLFSSNALIICNLTL